jgi:hypothetical protein
VPSSTPSRRADRYARDSFLEALCAFVEDRTVEAFHEVQLAGLRLDAFGRSTASYHAGDNAPCNEVDRVA